MRSSLVYTAVTPWTDRRICWIEFNWTWLLFWKIKRLFGWEADLRWFARKQNRLICGAIVLTHEAKCRTREFCLLARKLISINGIVFYLHYKQRIWLNVTIDNGGSRWVLDDDSICKVSISAVAWCAHLKAMTHIVSYRFSRLFDVAIITKTGCYDLTHFYSLSSGLLDQRTPSGTWTRQGAGCEFLKIFFCQGILCYGIP